MYILAVDSSLSMGLALDGSVTHDESATRYRAAISIVESILKLSSPLTPPPFVILYRTGEKIEQLADGVLTAEEAREHLLNYNQVDENEEITRVPVVPSGRSRIAHLISKIGQDLDPPPTTSVFILTDCASFDGDLNFVMPCEFRFIIVNNNRDAMDPLQLEEIDEIAAVSCGQNVSPENESLYHHFFIGDFRSVDGLAAAVIDECFELPEYTLSFGNMVTKIKMTHGFCEEGTSSIEVIAFAQPTNLQNMPVISNHMVIPVYTEKGAYNAREDGEVASEQRPDCVLGSRERRTLEESDFSFSSAKGNDSEHNENDDTESEGEGLRERQPRRKRLRRRAQAASSTASASKNNSDGKEAKTEEEKKTTEATVGSLRVSQDSSDSEDEDFALAIDEEMEDGEGGMSMEEEGADDEAESLIRLIAPRTQKTTAPLLVQTLTHSLRASELHALCRFNTGRYCVLSADENSEGEATLALSILFRLEDMPLYVPDLRTIRVAFDEDGAGTGGDLHQKETIQCDPPSYVGSRSCWLSEEGGWEMDLAKIRKDLKKLPDKVTQFYSDVNRMRHFAYACANPDVLVTLADFFVAEAELTSEVALMHATYVAEHYKRIVPRNMVQDILPMPQNRQQWQASLPNTSTG